MKLFYCILLTSFLSVTLVSCSHENASQRFIPEEESEFAKEFISKLKNRDFEYVVSKFSPELLPQVTDELLEGMAYRFWPGDPISVQIIGSEVHKSNGEWTGNFTFEYEFESGWNVASTALRRTTDGYEVVGVYTHRTEQSQREINAFNLSAKTPLQYFVLLLAVTVAAFVIFTLIACIRTPIPKRKWLWVIFIIFGVGMIQVNWTTGDPSFQFLTIKLFGASAVKAGPAAPWTISASIPLGAIIFWFRRKKFISQYTEAGISEQTAADTAVD